MKKTYKAPGIRARKVMTRSCMLNMSMGVSNDKVDNATAEGKMLNSVSFSDTDE